MSPIDPIREVPEPAPVPRSRGLGALVENSLVRFVVQVFNRAKGGLSDLLRHAVDSVLETLERPLISLVGPLVDDMLANEALPDSYRTMLVRVKAGEHQVGAAILFGVCVAALMYLGPAALSGLAAKVSQGSYNLFNPNLLDFGTWRPAVLRDPGYKARMLQELAWQGWTEQQVQAATVAAERRPDLGDLLRLWLREQIGDGEINDRLRQVGVAPGAVDEFKKLAQQIPGPGDLVRFALREAWRDDVAQKWGYDQDRVAEFDEWMTKQGYSSDWAKRYWRAHWVLPSVGQGFEMLHREEINEDELRDLLKVNDLAPGWIQPLMNIARPVPGRIDRRYAYREGAIGAEELFQLYKYDGYDDKWAQVLTDTTIGMAISETKGLTRASIEKAYRERRLSREEALGMMADLKIQRDIAEFYLDQADYDRADQLLDLRIDAVEKQYKAQTISESDAWDQLGALGLGGDEIEARLDVWRASIRISTRMPTKADLASWVKDGVIEPGAYRDRMLLLNYPAADVDLYLSALALERQEIAEDAERRAREEQERVRTARLRTDYQVDKAAIDVDIAEVNAAIAGAQVALVEAEAERDRQLSQALSVVEAAAIEAEYRPAFVEADAAIDAARLRIAELNAAIAERRIELQEVDQSLAANVDVAEQTRLKTERLSISTELARLDRQIAGHKTELARLQAELTTTEIPERIPEIETLIAELKVSIAEIEELQAEARIRVEQIDEALLVVLSPERRAALTIDSEALELGIRELAAEIAGLQEQIREVQLERNELDAELQAEIGALPGREEQVEIRARFADTIAEIERSIKVLRANVADLRIARAALAVEYREAGG